ncbi:MAG: HAMP domain-containing sensor histidine kinase [Pseudomonadota bacterium]
MAALTTTSALAHDIRNMLTPALLSAEVLSAACTQTQMRQISRILRAIDNSVLLCKDAMEKADSKSPSATKLSEVSSIVTEAVELAIPKPESNISVAARMNGANWIIIDQNTTMRIIFNLVKNAASACGVTGGKIVVNATAEDEKLQIDIIDNGPGLPASVLNRLFPKLVGATEHSGRIGLGLPYTIDAAKKLGGGLTLRSSSRRGTHFCVEVPYGNTNYPDGFVGEAN